MLGGWRTGEAGAGFEKLARYRLLFLTRDGKPRQKPLTKKPAADFPGALEALQREAERLLALTEHCNALVVARATRALLILGDAILEAYQRHKQARVLLDYDDLIHYADRLLARDGGGRSEEHTSDQQSLMRIT